jgi:hypothetical protein
MQVKANDVLERIDEHKTSEMDLTTIRRILVGREGTKCGQYLYFCTSKVNICTFLTSKESIACLLAARVPNVVLSFLALLALLAHTYKSTDGGGSHRYLQKYGWR